MNRFAQGVAVTLGSAVTVAGLLAGGALPASGQTTTPATAATAATAGHAAAVAAPAYAAPRRTLRYGARGSDVKALQQRLNALKYYSGKADGVFGNYTLEAVWAFQEVQRIGVDGIVGPATGRALVHPRTFPARYPRGGAMRVEISLSARVLVLYRGGKVALISHVSAGGGYRYHSSSGWHYATTPTGKFRTTRFMPGWITVPLGRMYDPVFFIGTSYAMHGSTSVPLNPVSHGCVRMPMDIATFFHTMLKTPGTPVYIYR